MSALSEDAAVPLYGEQQLEVGDTQEQQMQTFQGCVLAQKPKFQDQIF